MTNKTKSRSLKFELKYFLSTFFLLLFLLPHPIPAEEPRLTAGNHLEYVTASEDDKEIFHDWFDLNLNYNMLDLGLRYESHNPDDQGKDTTIFPFWYVQFSPEFLEFTAGNYYTMLGRGLILRSYENRDLRTDNNLQGAKGSLHLDSFDLTLLWGKPRENKGYERTDDPLYAADGKISPFDWMSLGGTYLETDIAEFGDFQLYGVNLSFAFPHLDLYAEYAEKDTDMDWEKPGRGFYLSSNHYISGFGLTLEYKDYKNFDFSQGEVTYNNPPSLTKEHLYTLVNRHAYVLNLSDEKGLQVQAISSLIENLSLLANYSNTSNHNDHTIFSEFYGEMEYDYRDQATIKGGLSRMKNKQETGDPLYLAPVFDFTYYLSESNSMNFLLEHLWTKKYQGKLTYYDQILSLSFSHSPHFSFTLTHERTSEWKTRESFGKKNWLIVTLDWSMVKGHNLSLSIGSRRAGKVCSGGICTDKPALDGAEIKLLSQF